MSLTNPNKPVTEARLQEFYHRIKSYLGFTEMPSEDMNEVISPLPSVQPRYHKYSTEEHIVGEWIDGSTIYEKSFVIQNQVSLVKDTWNTILSSAESIAIIDTLVSVTVNGVKILQPFAYRKNGNNIDCYIITVGDNIYANDVVTLRYTKSE